jgi:hypothetical protein
MMATANLKENNRVDKKIMVDNFITNRPNNSPVFICPDWIDLGIVYYYKQDYFKDYKNTRQLLRNDNIFPINNVNQLNDSLINNSRRVIYIDGWSQLVDKDGLILKKLQTKYKNIAKTSDYEGYTIYEFSN